MKSFLLVILSCGVVSYAFPIFPKTETVAEEMKLTQNSSDLPKKFCGVEVTEKELDSDSLVEMKSPRCGAPNIGAYTLFPGAPKWRMTNLTYSIENYPPSMNPADINEAAEKAFALWTRNSTLKITWVAHGGNISISFYNTSHTTPFKESVIAYAYGPGKGIGGDILLNGSVPWTLDNEETFTKKRVNLFITLGHEMGHAFGLAHSSVLGALMNKEYTPFRYQYTRSRDYRSLEPHDDDIAGIQTLYGPHPKPFPNRNPVN